MTTTCSVKYKNNGWNNCFFVQLFGGRESFEQLVRDYRQVDEYATNEDVIARELNVKPDDVDIVISAFDDNDSVGEFFEGVYEWLASKGTVLVGIAEEIEKINEKYAPEPEPEYDDDNGYGYTYW